VSGDWGSVLTDDGVRIAYRVDGPDDAPVLLLIHSLGLDCSMWEPQVEALSSALRVVRYDGRGHGRSDAPAGEYTVERLGQDALAVLDALDVERAHVCGLSMGGVVALWLAVSRPERIGRAVFANTAAKVGTPESWAGLMAALGGGMTPGLRDGTVGLFLSAGYRAALADVAQRIAHSIESTPIAGYVGCCAALRDADLRYLASTVEARSLVIGGELDEATPPALVEDLHAAIVPSELMVIPGVAHLSNLEATALFNRRLLEHLTRL
jgi:3-oxoadipate enol-lactonase